ncbi:hypothetical protein [Bradyrhizobium sp. STM 3557]|uniref:hypothetical protein n=1 Tax=Bradyrhizobium sp. STM 3557 TaxID=578920 RepID=UPI003890AC2C
MIANKDERHSIKVFDHSVKGETDRFRLSVRENLTGPGAEKGAERFADQSGNT